MSIKALVVDDSKTVRSLLAKILTALGFDTTQACDGMEGLVTVKQADTPFGLILADWNMPHMNGLELLRCLRANPDSATTPFIMVTTETELGFMVEALAAGANEYLMKPFTTEMLEAKLRILQVHNS